MQDTSTFLLIFPMLPLRDLVVFPNIVVPIFIGREQSIHALEQALLHNKQVFLVAQKDSADEQPDQTNIYDLGTVATILQMLKLPDNTVKVLVEGRFRARLIKYEDHVAYVSAKVVRLENEGSENQADAQALIRLLVTHFEQYVKQSKKMPIELLNSIASIPALGQLIDTIAAHMPLKQDEKQALLATLVLKERADQLIKFMMAEIDLLQIDRRIRGRVKKQMEKTQREYYLNEQMKAIQKELGSLEEGAASDLDVFEQRINDAGMSVEAQEKAMAELNKLRMMSPMAAEATVVRGYLEWMVNLPWYRKSPEKIELTVAKQLLDEAHYGLTDVKERILEYLAVHARIQKVKGPILCLMGPPGVGKTSLGKSIASATGREYVRMALGGVRDEAEIRGHRRTYIGSMPGKLLQKITKAGVNNPMFLLDEIDKMGTDSRGDPASALLEVLDPEQNQHFNDHYLEVDYDLSDVMFVCTSNTMDIPPALLDRMEVIRIPGYTEDEKLHIAQQHLIPNAIADSGLQLGEIDFTEAALRDLIRYYTKESGVRGLERAIAKICRKVVKANMLQAGQPLKSMLEEQSQQLNPDAASTLPTFVGIQITSENLETYHGVRKYNFGRAGKKNRVGIVTGLAWTSVGGELLTIEAVAVPGKGLQIKTGSLGDVMQESIQAALTVVRSRAASLGIATDFYEKNDVHIHVPEGATPKDGPSAGIAMCTALVSVFTQIPILSAVAMTGEITLTGEVLPIGGLKEKLLAAHRGDIEVVIIPKENARDLKEIPDNIKNELDIRLVNSVDEVLGIALEHMPVPSVVVENIVKSVDH
jgi:ATP-dependent Lon protease